MWSRTLSRSTLQANLFSRLSKRWFESNNHAAKSSQSLIQTSSIVQEGFGIQELPLVIKKVDNIDSLCSCSAKTGSTNIEKESTVYVGNIGASNESTGSQINIETEEGTAILFASDLDFLKDANIEQLLSCLDSCYTSEGVYSLLEKVIDEEINGRVALQALEKIMELESTGIDHREPLATNRDVIIKQLVDKIVQSRDMETLIKALSLLQNDKIGLINDHYIEKLSNEAVFRAVDGKCMIAELIELIKILSCLEEYKYKRLIDSLWCILSMKKFCINEQNIGELFKLLPCFNQSQMIVEGILNSRLRNCYKRMSAEQMVDILQTLRGQGGFFSKIMNYYIMWLSINIEKMSENQLEKFIEALTVARQVNDDVLRVLQNYVQEKGIQIQDPSLIATLVNYCGELQIRNSWILYGCAEHFLKHYKNYSISLLPPMLTTFGLLDYQPPIKYWEIIEQLLNKYFYDLDPKDIIQILLSCVYLERYPLNFVGRVFCSSFIEKIQSNKEDSSIVSLEKDLFLLTSTLNVECKDYQGSDLPLRKINKTLPFEIGVTRVIKRIYEDLCKITGGSDKFTTMVLTGTLPCIEFYLMDILIHPSFQKPVASCNNLLTKSNNLTVVLVIQQKYYCYKSTDLIGPQVMRIRQFRKLGMKVVTIDELTVDRLKVHPVKLHNYLLKRFENGLKPLR